MNKTTRLLTLASLVMPVACSGGGDGDDIPEYEEPQILIDSPICVNYRDVEVGERVAHSVVISNRGAQPLEIREGLIEDDSSGVFELTGIRVTAVGGTPDCTPSTPCSLEFKESAIVQFVYAPDTEGWHWANLRIRSNAFNLPNNRIFILALARPVDAPSGWEPPAKPDEALVDGQEACPESLRP